MPAITDVRKDLITLLNTTFAAEGLTALDDKLYPSLGYEGPTAGVFPIRETPMPQNRLVDSIEVGIQVYNVWEKDVDDYQTVDPTLIEGWAGRFKQALRGQMTPATDKVWYFELVGLDYPDDPTGNKTRFEAVVRAFGQNPTLSETTA